MQIALAPHCATRAGRGAVRFFFFLFGLLLLAITGSAAAQQADSAKPVRSADRGSLIARGKYIVDDVAMCGTCHTPHFASGAIDSAHALEGAPLWLNPTMSIADWPLRAPRLVGTPPGTDAELTTLLTTGIWKDGKRLRQPMPQFRMTREDAEAAIAYLRSMTSGPQ
jgi:mono/diheme cytochrome c family protein